MSTVKIQGNASGSGAFTIASPNGNTDRTMTLPDASITVGIGQVQAWVTFKGTGTVSIYASGNVSSITDNGTADYTANFSSSLTDDKYVVVGNTVGTENADAAVVCGKAGSSNYRNTNNIRFEIRYAPGNSLLERDHHSIAVIR